MRVAKDGSGDFISIQEAIESISEMNSGWITLEIEEGTYKEKVLIEKPWIRLVGKNPNTTIITYDDYANKKLDSAQTYGTFNSYSFFVGTHDFYAENITFENSAGKGEEVGQAIAAYVDGDRVHFKNCRFLGHQDTLFTGPLPEAPIQPGSFRGPREYADRVSGRQYYESCYIEGDVDFIFGGATAVFSQCEIFSKNRMQDVNGYITAASTPKGQEYGYLFEACRLTSDCQAQTVYLGRPWREYAQVAFVRCELGSHIKREGWHDWGKGLAREVTRFEEYQNTGLGSGVSQRVGWSKQMEEDTGKEYNKQTILKGHDGWWPIDNV